MLEVELKNRLMENIGTWIGILLGVVGLIAAYVFYRRSLIKPNLAFVISSVRITGRDSMFPDELKIFYGDKEVKSVSQSNIVIWNSGNATIDGEGIVKTDPLRLTIPKETEILAASILFTTREVNAFSIKLSGEGSNELLLAFDFLDSGDGALINLTHTSEGGIEPLGTIRGMPNGIKYLGDIPPPPDKKFVLQMSASAFLPIAAIVGIIYYVNGIMEKIFLIIVSLIFSTLGALGLLLAWRIRQRRPPMILLKKLRYYEDR